MTRTATHAELRVVRAVSALLGFGVVVAYVALALVIPRPGSVPDAPWLMDLDWWAHATTALTGLIAPWAGLVLLRRLQALNAVVTAAMLLLSAVVIWAVRDADHPMDAPFLISISGTAAISALIAWGDRWAWVVLAGTTVTVQVVRLGAGSFSADVLVNDLQGLASIAAGVAMVSALLGVGRHADQVAARVIAAEVSRAEEQARASVRTRTQALVHDEVLAVLLLASYDVPTLRPDVAAQANRARTLIGDLTTPSGDEPLPLSHVALRLGEAVREVAPDADLEVTVTDDLLVAPAAATALVGAARQALQNSVDHASRATRRVRVGADREGVVVVVEDDGPGFDPAQTPGARMGIRVSIVGRMESVAGGSAEVVAGPGAGTRVVLRWHPAALHAPVDVGADDLMERSSMLGNLRLAVVLFMATQVVVASASAAYAEDPRVPLLAALGTTMGVGVLGWRDLQPPGRARVAAALALGTLTTMLVWVPVTGRAMSHADWSYLHGVAFVLAMVAVRGRPGASLVGLVPLVALPLAAAEVLGYARIQVGPAVVRSVTLVVLSVASVALLARIRARTTQVVATEAAERRRQGWEEARLIEARERMRDLERLTGRVLAELEGTEPLSRAQVADCLALEGRLRDSYRGGRLARPPLVEAAAAARRRGVDVVLLDDAPDRDLDDAQLEAVVAWMCGQVGVSVGRFTGRILPPGRGAVASAVTGDEATVFPG